jgi:hypothetical protein
MKISEITAINTFAVFVGLFCSMCRLCFWHLLLHCSLEQFLSQERLLSNAVMFQTRDKLRSHRESKRTINENDCLNNNKYSENNVTDIVKTFPNMISDAISTPKKIKDKKQVPQDRQITVMLIEVEAERTNNLLGHKGR